MFRIHAKRRKHDREHHYYQKCPRPVRPVCAGELPRIAQIDAEKEAEFAKCEAIKKDMRLLGMKYGQIDEMP